MKMYHYSLPVAVLAIMTINAARADYRGTVLSHNPSAYWRLNETTPVPVDLAANIGTVGQAGNGVYLGVLHPVTPIPGGGTDGAATILNNPLNNGGLRRVRVPFQAGLNQAGPFTAEFWAKPAQAGTGTCPYSSIDFPNARGWLFYQEAIAVGQWSFRVYRPGGNNTISGGTVTAGAWHHVVGVYDGVNMSLYVNGALVAGPTAVTGAYTPVTNPNIPLTMGTRADGASGNWAYSGDLDEAVLYTNVLSGTDIAAHYLAGTTPTTPDYSAVVVTNNPVGYWRLGEPAPTLPVAVDSGYLGTSAQGTYEPNMTNGVAGPGYSGLGGATVAAFNGLGGYLSCGVGVPDLSAPLSSMSIVVWALFSTNRAMDWESIITCGDTAWGLQRQNNDYAVGFRFAGTDLWTPSTRPINDGQWHHIVATYDGAQQKIYLDGTLAASANKTGGNAGEGTYPILIGDNGQWPGRVFKGNLAEMAVFTNALSASDVLTIYNSSWTVPGFIVPAYASPANTVFEGTTVTLNAKAGGASLAYQWSKGGSPIVGATVSSYLLTTNALVADSGTYTVVVTNTSGSATSSVVLTVVTSPPLIVAQPVSTIGFIGGPAGFAVVDSGSLPRTYQWKHGATPVPGATTASLTLTNVQWGDAGTYTCTIVNTFGTTNTAPAMLTVGGEFVSLALPDTAPRDRHTALGSDGSNLYFTHGNTPNSAAMSRIPQTALTGWTSLAPVPTPPSINPDTGVNDLGYFGGSLYCWVTDPTGVTDHRVVARYDIAGDFWVYGLPNAQPGPNAACAVINPTNILGGWMGNNPVWQATDWTNGVMASAATLPGGAVHPWDACVGPTAAYFIKHYNVAASNAVLASFTKAVPAVVSYINGMPFNIGMGCAIEYMPASLFTDGHDRLYIERGMTGTTDDDAGEQYGHWTTPTTASQLAVYDLVSHTWVVGTLPFLIDVGSEMALVNQTLYILAGNADAQPFTPLKMLYLGPPMSPKVVNEPISQTIFVGQSAAFSVGVLAGGPVNYQWRHAGSPIPGATLNYYSIPSAYYTDDGVYDVVVSNGAGTNTSQTATLTVLTTPNFANLTNDLVLHLKFDGDYLDSSGRTNDATAQGAPTFVPGKLGQAVSLETLSASNTYNYVSVGTQPDFSFTEVDSFSVSFWMKFTNWANDLPMIGNSPNSTYQPGWVFAQDQSKIELSLVSVANSGTYVSDPVPGSPIINDGVWHNFVGVVDRGSQLASVYVDGALAGSYSIVGLGTLDYSSALTIGQSPIGAYQVDGAGYFDDVGIWRRALAPTEAQSIYMVGQQGTTFDTYGPVRLTIRKAGADLELIWQAGTLLSSTNGVLGTYNAVGGASAPYYRVTPGPTATFYRVKL